MVKKLVVLALGFFCACSYAKSFGNPYVSFEVGGGAQLFMEDSDTFYDSHEEFDTPPVVHDIEAVFERPDSGTSQFFGVSAGISFNKYWGVELGYRMQDIAVDSVSQTSDLTDSSLFAYWMVTDSADTVEMTQLRLALFRDLKLSRYVKSKVKFGVTQTEYSFTHTVTEWYYGKLAPPPAPHVVKDIYTLDVNEKVIGGYAGVEVGVLLTKNINLNLFVDMTADEFMVQTNAGINTVYYF